MLTRLHTVLIQALPTIGRAELDRHRGFLLETRSRSGGWAGRQGETDLYYTRFACRALQVLDGWGDSLVQDLEPSLQWLRSRGWQVADCVEGFCLADCMAVCHAAGLSPWPDAELLCIADHLGEVIQRHHAQGGCARTPGARPCFTHTLLARLTLMALEELCPQRSAKAPAGGFSFLDQGVLAEFISGRLLPGGGVADTDPAGPSQTPATAAAAVLLAFAPEPSQHLSEDLQRFLLAMQQEDGGFSLTADLPESDMLATCSALVGLHLLGGLPGAKLSAAARFVTNCRAAQGGFRARALDAVADTEYSYYGLCSLGLLAHYAAGPRPTG